MHLVTLHTEARFVPDSVSIWSMRTPKTDSVGRVEISVIKTFLMQTQLVLSTSYLITIVQYKVIVELTLLMLQHII